MNVADLLQEAPSDKRRPPQREQPPPPPPRERSRDRQLSSQGQQPAQQHTAHPPPSQHQQPSPPQPYRPPPSSKHSRPSSPPRSYQHDYGSSHSQQSQQRLPPPSAIIESLVGPRREEPQQLPPPHEQSSRSQYGQPSLGPPGPLSQQQQQQPYNDHPSSRSQARSSSNSHTHHQSQSHGHSSVQSSMYMPPPNSRSSLQQISKHGASSSGPGMPPPGHGSVPLYPTPVGPGMGPPPHHMESHPRASYSEPSVMYSGHPHAPPGASIMGALPPPHSHSSHAHQQHPSIHSRHRRTGSGGYHSQGGSPAMGSLQRSPYDERGGPLPPPSQLGGVMGPGQSPSLSREPSNASLRNTHMLTGPGAAGMHANPISSREREHYERERIREREREMEGRSMERRERELRGRDRDRMERELRERERAKERERREEERMHERDAMAATVGPDGLTEADREREWRRMQPPEPHTWPRFANPRIGDEKRDREFAMQQQLEWERDREREREIAMMDEKRAIDAAREMERTRQVHPARPSTREREPREKDRTRDTDRGGRREKHPDLRRVPGDEHGWLPEPPVQEVWAKDGRERERDRDRELRDRMIREREREIRESENLELVRASRQGGQNPQHHHHVHHHLHRHQHQQQAPLSGSQGHSKATKIRPIESEMGGPPIGPGGMPPPMSDLPPPSGLHKSMSKSSLGPGPGPGPGQMSHPQLPPQHFHPSNRLHPHPSHSFGGQSPMHYGRRPSPPPFPNTLNVSNNFMQPRSPRPPMLPTVPPVHVGTFVYPRTPFPFLDFPSPPDSTTSLLPQKEIPEIRAIIYMPSGFLPTRRPTQPKIWGGALVPSFSPIFAAPQLVNHMQSGMSYGYPKPHPLEIHGLRRVYTDDSDLFLCALHAGWVTWNMTRAAQEDGKDLRLEIRLTREARFIGGLGERYRGQESRESSEEDDGRGLLSAGWGNSHEGAGIEILRAEFVKKGTAHKFGLRNRSQRLAEHNERSITLGCVPHVRKRKRRAVWYDEDEEETPTVHDTFLAADAKLCTSRTLVLGYQLRPSACGFKYDADAVKSALFPENTDSSARPTKKRRLAITGLQMRVNGVARSAEPSQAVDDSVVIETLTETFLITPQAVDAQDKENAVSSRRYTVFLVNRQSTKPVKPKLNSSATPTMPAGVLTEAGKELPKTTSSTAKPSAEESSTDDKTTGAVAVDASVLASDVNGVSQSSADEASTKTADDISTAAEAANTKASPEPHASTAPSTGGSSTPMDLETPEPRSEGPSSPTPPAKAESPATPAVMEVETQEIEPQLAPPEPQPKEIPPIQILQKNLTEDDLLFDTDGISVLSSDVENGMRSGWKIEAKTWRWADESLISLV